MSTPNLISVHDAVPSVLYRFCPRLEYAQSFLKGSIRLGLMQGYATIADTERRDAEEGVGHFTFPGVVESFAFGKGGRGGRRLPPRRGTLNVESEGTNPCYVCCMSSPAPDELPGLAARFGHYVVRLDEPEAFVRRFAAATAALASRVGPVEFGKVRYDPAPSIDREPTIDDLLMFECFHKQPAFAHEREYRLLYRAFFPPSADLDELGPDHLWVNLGGPIAGASLLEIP